MMDRLLFLAPFWAALFWLGSVRVRTLLAYFQQEEYDAARFFSAWREIRLFDVLASAALILAIALLFVGVPAPVLLLVLALVLTAIAWRERRVRFKKPLVMTERATRLFRLALVLAAAIVVTGVALAATYLPLALQFPVAIVLIQLLPLALVAANALLKPGEDRRNQAFIDEAIAKLAGYKGIRIGVTGSFGKTSVKHILGQLLAIDAPVFYSRGSINTVLGLTRHIRQRLQPAHKYFIAEMGAYRRGSIKRLAEFVRPEIGIITAVGEAHLERFGSLADTAKAKAELAEFVCAHGRTVIVTEAVVALEPFASLRAQHPEKFVVCGTSKDADIKLVGTSLTGAGRAIDIGFDGTELNLVSPLLGGYSALNICLCVATIRAVAPEILPYLAGAIADLEQIPHRLEKRESVSGPLILDDAYNANEAGMREAIDTTRSLADERGGRAAIITPGIVELGDNHDSVHRALGEKAGAAGDIVHVVNAARIPSFVAGAESAGHASVKTHPSLVAARAALVEDELGAKDVLLYANDLPDVIEDRRIL